MSLFLPPFPLGVPVHHAPLIQEFLGPAMRLVEELPATTRFVFICFSNRCGSNYLAELLATAGGLNKADEVFNHDRVIEGCQQHGLVSLHGYVAHLARAAAVNSVLTAKLAFDQLVMLVECGVLDRIIGRTQFITMERLDKLGQAISLAIAEQNQQWAWYLPPTVADDDLRFSRDRIVEILDWITLQHHGFDRFFAWNSIVPIGVHYESLVLAPQTHVAALAARLGCGPLRVDTSRLELRRQATGLNRAWRERFLAGQRMQLSDQSAN